MTDPEFCMVQAERSPSIPTRLQVSDHPLPLALKAPFIAMLS
jgi:hypothetical protein